MFASVVCGVQYCCDVYAYIYIYMKAIYYKVSFLTCAGEYVAYSSFFTYGFEYLIYPCSFIYHMTFVWCIYVIVQSILAFVVCPGTCRLSKW